MTSNALYIITTKEGFLPGHPNAVGLFSRPEACDEQKTEAIQALFKNLGADDSHSARIWKLKTDGPAIFGVQCLPDNTMLNGEARRAFVKAVFQDVLAALGKDKDRISEVFFFGHRLDLSYDGKVKMAPWFAEYAKKDPAWPAWLGTNDFFKGKTIQQGDGRAPEKNCVSLYLTAFSHEGEFRDLLLNNTRRWGVELSIAGELRRWAIWMHGWEVEKVWKTKNIGDNQQKFLLSKPLPYHIALYYADNQFKIDKAQPQGFPYGDLVTQLNKSHNSESPNNLNIVFLPLAAIADFAEFQFFEAALGALHPDKTDNHVPAPTIFISFWDIMKEADEANPLPFPYELDRRHKFLDSSIWYRYVPINGNFEQNLDQALETIQWAYGNRLYQKNVCREYLEFQSRMLLNSYLDDRYGSGHAKRVFPFTFHSETAMCREAEVSAKSLNASELDWNILLIDDYAMLPLREGLGEGEGNTKGDIIHKLLSSWPVRSGNLDVSVSHINQFHSCESVDEAKVKLGIEAAKQNDHQKIVYDLVLLDYLFSSESLARKHFGTELLDHIQKASSPIAGIGVLQSYWIYPITVFNEAIQSHLQERGYQYMERHWQLTRGADPLNTPHLFRRSLFKFIESQKDKILFGEHDIWMFLAEHASKLLHENNGETASKNAFGVSPQRLDRGKARWIYRLFVDRFSTDAGLPLNSALAASVEKRLRSTGAKDLRDHLHQLLYLLGYSVGFDFTAIKEELDYIESMYEIRKSGNTDSPSKTALEEGMKSLSKAVYSITGKYF